MKFAAIDIGSNAVRLLFCNVFNQANGPVIKKSSLIRVPIRLGADVFSKGFISEEKAEDLLKAMKAFNYLMEVHQVVNYRAFATSAMRDAQNGKEVVERIKKDSGIEINIIDGKLEAEVIFTSHLADKLSFKKSYLYIDVGGGSTELTLFSNNVQLASHSFNIGTIRMLQKKEMKEEFEALKNWLKDNVKDIKNIQAIGTGGNINKLFKLSKQKNSKSISYEKLKEIDIYLNSFTYEERITTLGLNPDRADVIVQASKVFLTIMKLTGIKKIQVPQIGLSDGIIRILAEQYHK
ncbi:MAG: exopolyphosphatase [Bacteroidetes bacterium]|nr:exopolyphosphatase [Bacteroidota bacterium]